MSKNTEKLINSAPLSINPFEKNSTSQDYINSEKTITPEVSEIEKLRENLRDREEKTWRELLGNNTIKVTPPNREITPELITELEELKLQLIYIPYLDLGTLKKLKKIGSEKFFNSIQKNFPNRTHTEPISFWESVKEDKAYFPVLKGEWVFAESKPKPNEKHNQTTNPEQNNFPDLKKRFNVSWTEADQIIHKDKDLMLEKLGISGKATMRMPKIMECYLSSIRLQEEETNTYEWTNTDCIDNEGYLNIFVAGNHNNSSTTLYRKDHRDKDIGYRFIIAFPQPLPDLSNFYFLYNRPSINKQQ